MGPGFFQSFKSGGVRLNLMAVAIICLNIAVMFGCYYVFFDYTSDDANWNLAMLTGALFGAVTNTPGLGAATDALNSIASSFKDFESLKIANGYACAYPLGVIGIILATILIRFICRVNL